jgi:hypothetical protein
VANTIMAHYRIAGLDFRDQSTSLNTCDSSSTLHTPTVDRPALVVEHSLFFDNGFVGDGAVAGKKQVVGNAGFSTGPCSPAQAWGLFATQKAIVPVDPTTAGPDPGITVKYGLGLVDSQTDLNQFKPNGSQPLVTSLAMDCKTIDPFFDTTNYVGAFDPSGTTWLSTPWVSFELQ